jgi:hypothetical protein
VVARLAAMLSQFGSRGALALISILNKPTGCNPQDALLEHALGDARRGWSIIPVAGKKPVGLWTPFQSRPPDERTLRRLFAKKGVTGLAVITGAVSGGLAVRDFDQADAYHAWAAENPDDAKRLPTVKTARGFHVYGRLDEEEFATFPDGELRADSGHYVVLPPSVHESGAVYTWLVPLPPGGEPFPLLPPSLREEAPRQTQQPKQHIACVPQAVIDAIRATLPDGPGQRNRKVFELARRLKGIIPDASVPERKAIVVEWHTQALPFIRTKDFSETWTDFQVAWVAVKVPHGTAVRAAYEAARRAPEAPIDGSADLGVLAALCRNLSAGGRPFFLSCRTVEELFGVSRMTAWRWLQALQFFGVIKCLNKGTLKDRQATAWHYLGTKKGKNP